MTEIARPECFGNKELFGKLDLCTTCGFKVECRKKAETRTILQRVVGIFQGGADVLNNGASEGVVVECDEDTCTQVRGFQGHLNAARAKAARKIEEVNS